MVILISKQSYLTNSSKQWLLLSQASCPTCRALVVPPEHATAATGQQHGVQPELQHGNT